ncbi:MAG: MOSC domain-containing protein [Rhodospirillaceae bacterium]|nr:MOSC domain-containing protein [Rhodospirillaceae bacterium]
MKTDIKSIVRYSIKSLSGEHLAQVELTPGRALPGDRRYALRHGASAYDPARPAWQRKREFAVLVHTPALARLKTAFDPDTTALTIARDGAPLFAGRLDNPAARRGAEIVFNRVLKDPRGPLTLVDAGADLALTDMQVPYLAVINAATVRELSAKAGRPLDPLRFRGNLLIDGCPPWAEFGWVGREMKVGAAMLRVFKRIERCAATSVDPASATTDINVPKLLMENFGHIDCGIYAEVIAGGPVRVGDAVTLS